MTSAMSLRVIGYFYAPLRRAGLPGPPIASSDARSIDDIS